MPQRGRQYDLLYDSLVEVYDPRSGQLVARQQIPGFALFLGTGRRLIGFKRTADDRLSVTMSQVQLVRP
jgi:hypothetical protein